MQFKNFSIKNFRGFKEIHIENFKQCNLFVGKNNSGKSSILEALFLMVGISSPILINTIDLLRGGLLNSGGNNLRLIFNNFRPEHTIELKLDSIKKNAYRMLEISPNFQTRNSGDVNSSANSAITTDNKVSFNIINGINYNFTIKEEHKNKISYKSSLIITEDIKEPKEYKETLQAIIKYPHSLNDWGTLASRLDQILIDKNEEELIHALKEVDNRIQNIQIGANNLIYCDIEGFETLVPVHILGDGFKHILAILADIYFCKGGIYMIDEIDTGLHYSVLISLWKAIFAAAIKYDVQIFATSHSDECIRAYSQAYHESYGEEDNIRLYRIERNADNSHRAVKFDSNNLEEILHLNWEYR